MFETLITVVLPVFLVIGAGYGAARTSYLSASSIDGVMRFAQAFAIPCLLFRAIATIDLGAGFDLRLLASFYGGAILCFLAGIIGARLLFRRDWEDAVVIGFCCLFSNTVLLGLPITERAYGADALTGNYAIVAFHVPFCYGIGITLMEIVRLRGLPGRRLAGSVLRTIFGNPQILGILAGFVFNMTGLALPETVDHALGLIIGAGLPCAIFALGGVLVRYRPEGDSRTIAFICAVTLLLHPTLVWTFGTVLGLERDLFRSAVLTAAMAPGFNAYLFADQYGRAKRVTASAVLVATGATVLTAWFWLTMLG